jgi:hypothetical protein
MHQVSDEGSLSTLQRVKLGMKGESGIQQAGWVGDGLLATSTAEEPYIRWVRGVCVGVWVDGWSVWTVWAGCVRWVCTVGV